MTMRHVNYDSAPAQRARETVQLLLKETPEFISPDVVRVFF